MKVGDAVKYSKLFKLMTESTKKDITGVVMDVKGNKWVEVHWIDGVIYNEHVDDLEIIRKESRIML